MESRNKPTQPALQQGLHLTNRCQVRLREVARGCAMLLVKIAAPSTELRGKRANCALDSWSPAKFFALVNTRVQKSALIAQLASGNRILLLRHRAT